MYTTDMYEGMIAETITVRGHGGDVINAYLARPLGPGPHPGMVLAHHMPGWDEWYRETAREVRAPRLRDHLPRPVSPHQGHGTPDDVAARVRSEGGADDEVVVGDLAASMDYLRSLPNSSGKVGAFGTCSGGRHVLLAASRVTGFDAVVDCWGGRVVMSEAEITAEGRRSRPSTTPPTSRAPCWGCSARRTRPRHPSRSRSTRRP